MPAINFSGIASGIDSNALIAAISESARSQRVAPSERKVTQLQDTSAALTELKSKLSTLQSQIRDLSSINGGALTKQGSSTDETIATASASNSAANGTFTLNVVDRAKNATFSFDDRWSTSGAVVDSSINDGAPAVDRTVSFSVGTTDPKTVSVVLTSTTTASDFVTQFNESSASNGSRATAALVNVGTTAVPSYAIIINTSQEGTATGEITLNAHGAEVSTLATNTLSQATDAEFTLSGVTGSIIRSSNSVSDVIPGVTLNLNDTGTATVSIIDDASATAGNVEKFIETYNKIVAFIAENNKISREEDGGEVENVFAPLSTQRTDDNFLINFRSDISGANFPSGGSIRIFADLGITTERDGTLKFDSAVFKTAIASEPTSANAVLMDFADTVSLTGGTLDQYLRFNGLFDSVINSNSEQVTSLNNRIADAEAGIAKQEESLRARFARLEGLIGTLQNQQTALTSALSGLGG